MSDFLSDDELRRKPNRAVKLASGYESDSDGQPVSDASDLSDYDDNASGLEKDEEKPEESKKINESDDDDDDMFAFEVEDIDIKPVTPTKKAKTFDLDHFEEEHGLGDYKFDKDVLDEFHSKGSESAVQLEAFNLREEVDSGKFDKHMNYICKDGKDSDDEEWVTEASAEEMKKAREAEQAALAKRIVSLRPTSSLLSDLIQVLEPAENSMEALGRLRPTRKKRSRGESTVKNARKDSNRKQLVFQITECCEQLRQKGISSAYDMSREELMRAYRQETGEDHHNPKKISADKMAEINSTDDAQKNVYGDPIWQYRWCNESDVHGPYSTYEMNYWKDAYFENNVEVKRVDSDKWIHVSNINLSN